MVRNYEPGALVVCDCPNGGIAGVFHLTSGEHYYGGGYIRGLNYFVNANQKWVECFDENGVYCFPALFYSYGLLWSMGSRLL